MEKNNVSVVICDGSVYIITSPKFTNTYKIGRCATTENELICRYKTAYGAPINELFRDTVDHKLAETFIHTMLDKYRYGKSELFDGWIELFKCVVNCVCDHIDRNIISSIQDVCYYQHIITDINIATTEKHLKNILSKFSVVNNPTKHTSTKRTPRTRNITNIYTCTECNKSFNRSDNYNRHMKKTLPCKPKQKHKCPKCQKIFTRRRDLDKHTNRKFPCKSYSDIVNDNEKLQLKYENFKLKCKILKMQKY